MKIDVQEGYLIFQPENPVEIQAFKLLNAAYSKRLPKGVFINQFSFGFSIKEYQLNIKLSEGENAEASTDAS